MLPTTFAVLKYALPWKEFQNSSWILFKSYCPALSRQDYWNNYLWLLRLYYVYYRGTVLPITRGTSRGKDSKIKMHVKDLNHIWWFPIAISPSLMQCFLLEIWLRQISQSESNWGLDCLVYLQDLYAVDFGKQNRKGNYTIHDYRNVLQDSKKTREMVGQTCNQDLCT